MFAGFQDPLPWHCPNSSDFNESLAYFENQVLGLTDDTTWSNYGTLQWKVLLALFAAWCLVCVCTLWGVKTSGRLVHFTVLYPVVVFIIFTIVGLSYFDESYIGLREFMTPDMSKLADFQVRFFIKFIIQNMAYNFLVFRYGGKLPHKCFTLWDLVLEV